MSDSTNGDGKRTYRRVLLKLSGESFSRAGERGIGMDEVLHMARQVQQAASSGCQIALVIGGGNILRGSQFKNMHSGIQEATAILHGMLATVINGPPPQKGLNRWGAALDRCLPSAWTAWRNRHIRRRATTLEKDASRTWPLAPAAPTTTDTAAPAWNPTATAHRPLSRRRVQRRSEKNPHAVLYRTDYKYTSQNLRVMDSTAVPVRGAQMPIPVFNYRKEGNIQRAAGRTHWHW